MEALAATAPHPLTFPNQFVVKRRHIRRGLPRGSQRPGTLIRCPWHKFEFDLETGRALHDPERFRVKVYLVALEDGLVVLDA